MMRHWIFIAALLFAGAARAENVLMKSNGLGAAALGGIGVAVGAAAISDPQPWQGFPKGDGGPQFVNDAGVGQSLSDCATAEGSDIAKALKAPEAQPAAEPQGQIRLAATPAKPASGEVFDSKAIYQAGPATCSAK